MSGLELDSHPDLRKELMSEAEDELLGQSSSNLSYHINIGHHRQSQDSNLESEPGDGSSDTEEKHNS